MRSIPSLLNLATLGLAIILSNQAIASETTAGGNAEAGKALSSSCVACHGPDGNSPAPTFPKIAGQVPGYIAAQLKAFQDSENLSRNNAVMMGMVGSLSEQDMLDLDAYYASQEPTGGSIDESQKQAALAGEEIYRAGIAEFSVTACMACHGPDGKGVAPNFPRLAGQHATYIEAQLNAFKNGDRKDNIMTSIAFPLSAEQINQLALYISALK